MICLSQTYSVGPAKLWWHSKLSMEMSARLQLVNPIQCGANWKKSKPVWTKSPHSQHNSFSHQINSLSVSIKAEKKGSACALRKRGEPEFLRIHEVEKPRKPTGSTPSSSWVAVQAVPQDKLHGRYLHPLTRQVDFLGGTANYLEMTTHCICAKYRLKTKDSVKKSKCSSLKPSSGKVAKTLIFPNKTTNLPNTGSDAFLGQSSSLIHRPRFRIP